MFTFFPKLASPTYDRWFTFECFPILLFLISTKFPTLDPSLKVVPGLSLAYGPIEHYFQLSHLLNEKKIYSYIIFKITFPIKTT